MSNSIAQISDAPHWLVRYALAHKDDADAVEAALAEHIVSSSGVPDNIRAQARALIKYAVEEREADSLAEAPVSTDYLSRRVDTALVEEVERVIEECKVLRGIVADAGGNMNKRYKAFGNQVLTAEQAQDRLTINIKLLLDIKKSASDQKKADGGGATNVNLNFGNILGEAIKNIKEVEAEVL